VAATQLPFDDAGFDGVIANHMLYHVEDRARALTEIQRVLTPGGRLYATTVGQDHLRELWALVEQISPGVTAWTRRAVAGFTLENGRRQLTPHLSEVSLKRYVDTLLVTEVEPPIAYVQSAIEDTRFALSGVQLTAFRRLVRQRLEHQGALQITKDVGLFTAVRPE
jgi:ubiquinone/menaquinone biosynthesis C-methylase UbiE